MLARSAGAQWMSRIPLMSRSAILPNFFLIGAPKSGTTALSEYLRGHPNVFFSDPKEPEYYASDFRGRVIETEKDYARLFETADPSRHLAIGEGSVLYVFSRAAGANILRDQPAARFILMLRNPAELVISLHAQHLMEGNESLVSFLDAWNAEADRREGRRIPPGCRDPQWLYYSEWGRLGSQLKRVRQALPASSLKVIVFDDFARDTGGVYREVLAFLGIPDDGRTEFPKVNERRKPKSPRLQGLIGAAFRSWMPLRTRLTGGKGLGLGSILTGLNAAPAGKNPLPEVRRMLAEFYKEEVLLLEELLQRDLSSWRCEDPR